MIYHPCYYGTFPRPIMPRQAPSVHPNGAIRTHAAGYAFERGIKFGVRCNKWVPKVPNH